MNSTTKSYRRYGAFLSMPKDDVDILLARKIGILDSTFNNGYLVGVYVPGCAIDQHIPDESPTLTLVGRITIVRGDQSDRITSIKPINIDWIFEEINENHTQ